MPRTLSIVMTCTGLAFIGSSFVQLMDEHTTIAIFDGLAGICNLVLGRLTWEE